MSNHNESNDTKQQDSGRAPDYLAYNVNQTREGKGIFNHVGAAWEHKDGKGYDLQLDSMPINGRVTLRERRDEQLRDYEQQSQSQSRVNEREQDQTRSRDRNRERR